MTILRTFFQAVNLQLVKIFQKKHFLEVNLGNNNYTLDSFSRCSFTVSKNC